MHFAAFDSDGVFTRPTPDETLTAEGIRGARRQREISPPATAARGDSALIHSLRESSAEVPIPRPSGLRWTRVTEQSMLPVEGRNRVVVEGVTPQIDGGAFPVRRVVGDDVTVEADAFCDGIPVVRAAVRWRPKGERAWQEREMTALGNDRWRGQFSVAAVGLYEYTVYGWIDPFRTWKSALEKRLAAGSMSQGDLLEGASILHRMGRRARGAAARTVKEWIEVIESGSEAHASETARRVLGPELEAAVERIPYRDFGTAYAPPLRVLVDPATARSSAWYELFPRSTSPEAGRPGTFRDLAARLPAIAEMGFDVAYLPPIHPIGRTHRKGPNNTEPAGPNDPGSPWAIGGKEGGHTAVHPALGTLDEFDRLVETARRLGIEIALDLAFQCSPDHPWVTEHPEWFQRLPDGSIRTAENPPKKYEDIFPLDFESVHWRALWTELKHVIDFWVGHGVRRFRVDNPHTKPFAFWEWLFRELRSEHPEVLFLGEAFTRPKVMYRLAKVGFHHSYTYFAWRNYKGELTSYLTELTSDPVRQFFRPHLWPNTPDILTDYLQTGGRAAFVSRFVLAATLSPNYGIYGPAFELMAARAVEPGKEEYLDSEKYEIRHWPADAPGSLRGLITRVNRARRSEPALTDGGPLTFHAVDNDSIIAYSRRSADRSSAMLMFVNLDPHFTQSGWTHLTMEELGLTSEETFQAHDLLTDRRFLWRGPRNYVELRPQEAPAHLFRVRKGTRRPDGTELFE